MFEKQSGISYIHRVGNKESTLVLLHGIGSSALSFQPIIDLLPDRFNVIAWHAPGYADSEPLQNPSPTARDYADQLHIFLNVLGIENCVILGHSLGTLIGAEYARYYGDRVSQLFLAACACGYGWDGETPLPENIQNRIDDVHAMPPQEFANARAKNLVFEPHNNPHVVTMVENEMQKINRGGYEQASKMLASGHLENSLSHVTMPTEFIIGKQDSITPMEQTHRAMVALPTDKDRNDITIIDKAGHAVYQQQPEHFINALFNKIMI